MSEHGRDWAPETRLLHGTRAVHGGAPVAPAIYQTSTFQVGSSQEAAEMAAAVAPAVYYGRLATPNTKQVEAMLADLEGAEAALATGSGMAAVTIALMANLRAGDHVVAQLTHYTAPLTQMTATLPRYGIAVTQVNQTDTFQSDGERDAAGIAPALIRLSVGIERVEDIIGDLDRALS